MGVGLWFRSVGVGLVEFGLVGVGLRFRLVAFGLVGVGLRFRLVGARLRFWIIQGWVGSTAVPLFL